MLTNKDADTLRAQIARLRVERAMLIEAGKKLITAVASGTVYDEAGEPSYHNGPMGPLFEAVEALSDVIAIAEEQD